MGWASGSSLAESLWMAVREHILPADRRTVGKIFYEQFVSMDCDTIDEAEQLMDDTFEKCPDCGRWLQFDGHCEWGGYECEGKL